MLSTILKNIRTLDKDEQDLIIFLIRLVSVSLDFSLPDIQNIVFKYIQLMKKNFKGSSAFDSHLILKNHFKFNLNLPNISSLLTLKDDILFHGDLGLSDTSMVCFPPFLIFLVRILSQEKKTRSLPNEWKEVRP